MEVMFSAIFYLAEKTPVSTMVDPDRKDMAIDRAQNAP